MTFSIYGVSRSGKDYLIQKLKEYFESRGKSLLHVNGSATLNEIASERFSKKIKELTEDEKNELRISFIEYIHKVERDNPFVVVDGHYAFYDGERKLFKVFTEYDLRCYEKFFYLDTKPEDIVSRMRNSEGDKKNTSITAEAVYAWQNFEIDEMTKDLLEADKELHIVRFDNDFCLEYIFDTVTSIKYDSKVIADQMLAGVELTCSTVILTDCDKTLSVEDSTNIALDYIGASKKPLKDIFGGDRYSNYQMMLANRYYESIQAFTNDSLAVVRDTISINTGIIEDLKSKVNVNILAISAGNSDIWKGIIEKCGLNATVLQNNGVTSKYVKYYIAKRLRERGKFVIAIGDSILDSLMLCEANIGYLATKGYRANIEAFVKSNKQIRQLSYYEYKYDGILTEDSIVSIKTLPLTVGTQTLIDVCKSDSGATGKKLREAHTNLGSLVAKTISQDFRGEKFAVVIMMRSGLSFGMGIADELDAPVLFYDDKNTTFFENQLKDNPQLQDYRFILCDGVVNTGKTILELANAYQSYRPIIATNVISEKYEGNNAIAVYASRVSKHSYTGAKQKTIHDGKGPDTSDRLFNLI